VNRTGPADRSSESEQSKESIMAEQNPQVVQAQSIIEAKLTKSEAIDIMVDDLVKELNRALKNAEIEKGKLERVAAKDLESYLKNELRLSYNEPNSYSSEKVGKFTVNWEFVQVPETTMLRDSKVGEQARKLKEITKEISTLRHQLHQLTSDKSSTKVTLLKTILNGSPEGREWLAQLDSIRRKAALRFNIKINPRLLAGKE
jgi:hypothetical protein